MSNIRRAFTRPIIAHPLRTFPLDNPRPIAQNGRIGFNQPIRFSSLNPKGRPAALNSFLSGVFTSAIPCFAFSNGKQGREALRLLELLASLLTRLLFPAHTFSSVAAGLITPKEEAVS